ncbi:hypothetical protein BJX62DRAFT_50945 [Aspergillus germanicus]
MRRCESGEGTPHSNTQLQVADICLTFLAALVKSPGILRWQRRDCWFSSISEALKELQKEMMRSVTLALPNNQNHRLASKVFFALKCLFLYISLYYSPTTCATLSTSYILKRWYAQCGLS